MKKNFEAFRKSRWFPLVIGIISIVIGILCIANPAARMETIAVIAGVIFLIYGLLQIISGLRAKDNKVLCVSYILIGIVLIVLAILTFANKALIGKYLPTLSGLFMIVSALSVLIPSLSLLKNGVKSWWVSALPSLILLVLGLIFLLAPGFVGQTYGIFAGIAMVVNGLTNLIAFFQFGKKA